MLLLYVFALGGVTRKARSDVKPRLVWVCAPIINIKYASEAMRQAGYFSRTVVYTHSTISERRDFDWYRFELFSFYEWLPQVLVNLIEPYIAFIFLLTRFDIFHFFYDGGVLSRTPLRFLEVQLLHLFGKKVVVMPYGGDVHVLSRMRNPVYKFGQLYHYAEYAVPGMDRRIRWIDYFSKHADCCIGSLAFDALYRWDVLPVSYVAIDTDLFRPPTDYEYRNDGKNGPVVIVHSPNHRVIKGTEYIIAAVEKLKSEGFQIDFQLLEKIKNTEVRAVLERSDVLVELLVSGYGLSGIEGMSLGKPVISNFQADTSVLKHYSYLNECPIVQANIDTIYERLKWLVENPGARREIGDRGRRYAEKYHSYVSQQIMWNQVYRKIWHGENADLMMLFHPLLGRYAKLYDEYVARGQQ
jgi:glycosyltransferase involved in cell wall biosynthesis